MSTISVGRMKVDTGLARARYHVAARARTSAPAEKVWALLADVSTWSHWGPWDTTELIEPGPGDPAGVGAVRRIQRGRFVSIEEVVGFQAPFRLAYKLRSGLPLRNYRAEVLVRPVDDGSVITWHAAFDGAPRGAAPVARLAFGRFLSQVTKALARAAEHDV